MRKYTFVFILFAVLFLFSSCEGESPVVFDAGTDDSVIANTDTLPEADCVEIPLLTLTSVEEYKKFIRSQGPGTVFLTEEELSVFGDLTIFVTGTYEGCEEAHYEFVDANGQSFTLDLDSLSSFQAEESEDLNQLTVDSFTDLRCPKNGETGVLLLGDAIYRYGPYGLASIRWVAGDCHYIIYAPHVLPTYPMDGESTLISRLLTLATAESAIQDVKGQLIAE